MNRKIVIGLFLLLIGLYAWLSFSTPIDADALERYNLSANKARWLRLSVMAPVVIIWLIALWGFLRLLDYTRSIKGSKEAPALAQISQGLLIIAFGLPIVSIISSLVSIQDNGNGQLLPTLTMIRNYSQAIFPLLGFWFICQGAEKLAITAGVKYHSVHHKLVALGFIFFATVYTAFLLNNPFSTKGVEELYYLPTWLVVTTLIVPYLFTWYNGFLAAYYIVRYRTKVRGHLYKHAFSRLGAGLLVITVTAIVIRIFTSLNEQLTALNLTPFLFILYVLIVLYGLGYWLVASGSNRLMRLEKS